jgi:hypothetical protein
LVLVFGAVREADLIRQPEVLLGSRCGGVSKAFLSAVALALVLPACGGVALTPKRDTDAGDGTDLSVMTGADAANSTTAAQTGCRPGITPLLPRTLDPGGANLFTALAWNGASVLATSTEALRSYSVAGDGALTLVQGDLSGLVVVGGTAYYVDVNNPGVRSLPVSGGTPKALVEMPVPGDGAVADGEALYFKGYGTGIVRISLADATVKTLPLPPGTFPNALAVQGGFVYVAGEDLRAASGTLMNGLVARVNISSGAAEAIVVRVGHTWNLVADPGGLTWVQDPPSLEGNGSIVRANLDGTGMRTLANHGASALAVSGSDLYVASDSISRIPLAGGTETVLVPGLKAPGLLIVGDRNAAWVDPATKALSDATPSAIVTTCW